MLRSESTTPYTSLASSSNESWDVGGGGRGAMGLCACVDKGVCGSSSFTATTMPEDTSEVRLPYSDPGLDEG